MAEEQDIELWVSVPNDTNGSLSRNIRGPKAIGADPFNSLADESFLQKVTVKRADFAEKIAEVTDFIAALADRMKHSRVRLDEVSVSFELSGHVGIKWILGAEAKGGTSFKFKIDPVK